MREQVETLTRWTHSVIAMPRGKKAPRCCMTIRVNEDGEIVDSSAKLYGAEVATYFKRLNYEWSVAIPDEGRAMEHLGMELPVDVITFDVLANVDNSIVLLPLTSAR